MSTPSVNQWLAGDTTYSATINALNKALADYRTRMLKQQGQYNTEYNMNTGNLATSRQAAVQDTENDFASRGVLRSGVYGKSQAALASDYNARQNALDVGKANFTADLTDAQIDFTAEQSLAKQQARQNAINRRAARYGI